MGIMRYPGGKSRLVKQLLEHFPAPATITAYAEPFIGAGSVLEAYAPGMPDGAEVMLADKDPGIAALWRCVHRGPEKLLDIVDRFSPVSGSFESLKEFAGTTDEEIAFAKIALHQISFSGLGERAGGPIGGRSQNGESKVDSRWNPKTIRRNLTKLHKLLSRFDVTIVCGDFEAALDWAQRKDPGSTFVYLDPPYVLKGGQCYAHSLNDDDHRRLAARVKDLRCRWRLSYDGAARKLYEGSEIVELDAKYSMSAGRASDVIATGDTAEILIRPPPGNGSAPAGQARAAQELGATYNAVSSLTQPDPGLFQISYFESEKDNDPKPFTGGLTWSELETLLRDVRETDCNPCPGSKCPHKLGPAWSPVSYLPGKIRAKVNVDRVYALVVDLDHLTEAGLIDAAEKIEPYEYIAHASHSDRPGDRCLRVVIPLDKPIAGGDWDSFWPAAMAYFGLPADENTSDASRLYFLPSRPKGADPTFETNQGKPLDVATIEALAPEITVRSQDRERGTSRDVPRSSDRPSESEGLSGRRGTGATSRDVAPVTDKPPDSGDLLKCPMLTSEASPVQPDTPSERQITAEPGDRLREVRGLESTADNAAATLLARHWPKTGKHYASLALAGALAHAGRDEDFIAEFITAIARTVNGNDGEPGKRRAQAASSIAKVTAGEQVSGWPTLARRIPAGAVGEACKWLGIDWIPDPVDISLPAPEPGSDGELLARAFADVRGALTNKGKSGEVKLLFELADDILRREYPDAIWLVNGLLTEGGTGVVAGEPKSIKTWIACEIAIGVATGTAVCGKYVTGKARRVAYFFAEDFGRAVRNRLRALLAGRGREDVPNLHAQPRGHFLDLLRDEDLALIVASLRRIEQDSGKVELLILEPLRDIHSGQEDKSDDMAEVMRRLRVIEQVAGCTVLVCHHSAKSTGDTSKRRAGQKMRGSGAIHGSVDSGIYLGAPTGDGKTIFETDVTSEIKSARGAGRFSVTLTLEDDLAGEAVKATWAQGGADGSQGPAAQDEADERAVMTAIVGNKAGLAWGNVRELVKLEDGKVISRRRADEARSRLLHREVIAADISRSVGKKIVYKKIGRG
jgi:site-specific DNA-adenine methylase